MRLSLGLVFLLLVWHAAALAAPSYQETARFLAGLPVMGVLQPLTSDPQWIEHSKFFDNAWSKLERRQLGPIRTWSAEYLKEAFNSRRSIFYLFSGPDFLYAHTFFPNSSNYVLCGIEPVGSLPDISRIPPGAIGPTLRNIEASVNSVMNYSFFITKEMRVNLQSGPVNGTLPILFMFLARLDCTIHDVEFVSKGVKITFVRGNSKNVQALYYFSTDLANDGGNAGFFKFCESFGDGTGFTKSASYLMYQQNFSRAREWLLNHCVTIVQDDSGIPVEFFDSERWRLRLFGTYLGPIEIFQQYNQPRLSELYKTSSPAALLFGIGYRGWDPSKSTLMVAFRR